MIFPSLCFQSITPSPEQGVRVWLAVHEDGLSVLELISVVRICEPQTYVLVTFVHGRLAVFYKCIRALNLISKNVCV